MGRLNTNIAEYELEDILDILKADETKESIIETADKLIEKLYLENKTELAEFIKKAKLKALIAISIDDDVTNIDEEEDRRI